MLNTIRRKYGFYIVIVLFWLLMTLLKSAGALSSHFASLLVPMTYYAIAAVALNLCVGILGELSIGHAGFMCIGAFSGAIFSLLTKEALPGALRFFLAFLVGIALAALFGFLIGIPVLRLKGDYLAIVTLAFGEIIKNILQAVYFGVDSKGVHLALDMTDFTLEPDGLTLIKGPQGVSGTPRDSSFTVGIIVLLLALVLVHHLMDSRDGRAIMAIRDNRIAAEATGIHVTRYKMLAFTLSAAIAGAAGVLFSHNVTTMTNITNYFNYNASIMLLVYVVLGGIGNINGSVVAAMILYLLPEMMRGLQRYRMLIYAIVLILMMLFNWSPALVEKRRKAVAWLKNKLPGRGKGVA
ncbi:MAG: branched-chain amino acid ABC transporter permease [Lachnospiraceae bacterium]|nr:branched-chain amino acid ABC transporter permease [Lachnospiraceae bacterium]